MAKNLKVPIIQMAIIIEKFKNLEKEKNEVSNILIILLTLFLF